jgi:hypothetical protein
VIVESGVKHVVVFWLKEGSVKDKALALISQLASLPQVQSLAAGGPIDHDWAAVSIDKSWHIGFVAELKTKNDCRAYFHEPLHRNVAGQLRDMSERIFAMYMDY